jgi:hypothetical protein
VYISIKKRGSMKDIPGYEKYYACDENGNIYSLERKVPTISFGVKTRVTVPFKKLSLCVRKDGYLQVNLRKNGKAKPALVHRLIAITFLNATNKDMVNHKNCIRHDNRLSNLELCNRSYNIKYAFKMGTKDHRGNKHPRYYIDEDFIAGIKFMLDAGISQTEIAWVYGVPQRSVSLIKLGLKY